MIRSKFQFGEVKISIRKIILTGGRNIKKEGTCKIYIEVIAFYADDTRKTRRIPTGVSVNPKFWEPKKDDGNVSSKDPDSFDKNAIINKVYLDCISLLSNREQGTWVDTFIPENLISIEDLFPKTTKTLTNYIDDYISFRKSVNTPRGTIKEFTTCKNRLVDYENFKKIKLTFDDINLGFSDSFYTFMLSKSKPYMSGTIHKTYAILITILNHFYVRQEELNIKLSSKYLSKSFKRGQASVNDPKPLSRIELSILIKHKFDTDTLNKMKERFLFQCSTGMRYGDAFLITRNNIKDECIEYYPHKTIHKRDNLVICPLNPLSKSILGKYDYNMSKLKISNQKYNEGLGDMFAILIEKYPKIYKMKYTSHNGRDTFITNSLESGIDVPTLMKMVGQESYNVMKRYFKVSKSHSISKMELINEYKEQI
jgi:integrase